MSEEKREDVAWKDECFPINSLPFLNRCIEILKENGTNNPNGLSKEEHLKIKKNMYILIGQTFGQLSNVDLVSLYDKLEDEEGETK